jgi:succinate dehydrogenase/fumarate reductase flavoprotein subunit
VLVIGGGLAGIQAAEVAAQFVSDVLLVDAHTIGGAAATLRDASVLAAYLAQDAGGVSDWKSSRVSLGVGAIPGSPQDPTAVQRGYREYLRDIADTGCDLSDPRLADFTAAGVYNRIGWLESYGLHVSREPAGTYRGLPAPGHGLNRVLLLDEPPREVIDRIRRSAEIFGVDRADGLYVTRLLLDGERVAGAYALDARSGEPVIIEAPAVVLAAGGADRLYRADPAATAGEGYQLALAAGVELANIEFVAFGPEASVESDVPAAMIMILLSLGARVQRPDGSPAITELRSPARLARELVRAGDGGGPLHLHVPPDVRKTIADLRAFEPSLDALERPVEIRVGCHGLLGGVVHRSFATDVEGLFVAGAVATGCHGADLLPGVDTSFTLYSAENAATAAATHWSRDAARDSPAALRRAGACPPPGCGVEDGGGQAPALRDAVRAEEDRLAAMRSRPRRLDARGAAELEHEVRRIMWERVGPDRTGPGLSEAARQLHEVRSELDALGATGPELVALCRLEAMVATAELVCRAALMRQESRGQHARTDFPARDDVNGRSWITVARRSGALDWRRVPVPV